MPMRKTKLYLHRLLFSLDHRLFSPASIANVVITWLQTISNVTCVGFTLVRISVKIGRINIHINCSLIVSQFPSVQFLLEGKCLNPFFVLSLFSFLPPSTTQKFITVSSEPPHVSGNKQMVINRAYNAVKLYIFSNVGSIAHQLNVNAS